MNFFRRFFVKRDDYDALKRDFEILKKDLQVKRRESEMLHRLQEKIDGDVTAGIPKLPLKLFLRDGNCYLASLVQKRSSMGYGLSIHLYDLNRAHESKYDKGVSFTHFTRHAEHIYITEFNGDYYSRGYGSMVMEALIHYAQVMDIRHIRGSLSFVDLNSHKDRLLHFYRKHGFEIFESKNDGWKTEKHLNADRPPKKEVSIDLCASIEFAEKLAAHAQHDDPDSIRDYLIRLVCADMQARKTNE